MKPSLSAIEKYAREHDSFRQAKSKGTPPLPRGERIELYLRLIADIPHGTSCEETKAFADTVLNAIEDEFSCVPNAPDEHLKHDRLYPAQADARRASADERVAVYRHKAHLSHFGANGAILVSQLPGRASVAERRGSDGLTIGDLLGQRPQQLPQSAS
jgi:hypothetical protein